MSRRELEHGTGDSGKARGGRWGQITEGLVCQVNDLEFI